jgi:RNA polymerase sigma factor (sigma-70 family)
MIERERLTECVRRAQGRDPEAFGWIVRRFQDMAVGYAASILGDFHLAEDAAQEVFLEAWRDLPQLREPAAFAGWLRRIIFKQCDRLTRAKRLPTVPIEAAGAVASPQPGPGEAAERRELQETVRHAIQSLPEGERTVTVLFYISEYSQPEIAAFLGLAVITVKKRLAAARRRLKERMITLMQEDLRAQRPSQDDTFANRVLTFSLQFSEMVDAGNSLDRCFTNLTGRQDDEQFRQALAQIHREVMEGQTLSSSMRRQPQYFTEEYVKAVRLGEVTGTLEIQLQRLAAREPFDFEGDDNLEHFRAESPTIVRLAEATLEDAIRRGVSDLQIVLYHQGLQTDLVYLIDGICQQVWSYSRDGRSRPLQYMGAALFARYKMLAQVTEQSARPEGQIHFTARDGKEYKLPVAAHPTYSGEALVITLKDQPTSRSGTRRSRSRE